MTWQRIDENTSIDDTLVTSMEYQLFIDEMYKGRKYNQRKYYQPDHWTSYQFAIRQAREPILGVRHSDAQAFCKWLTERDAGSWCYRLPTYKEGKKNLFTGEINPALGYWIIGDNDHDRFAWIGSVPIDPRHIIGSQDLILAFDHIRNHVLQRNFERTLDREQALESARTKTSALDRARGLERAHDLETHSKPPFLSLKLTFSIDFLYARDRIRSHARALYRDGVIKREIESGLDSIISFASVDDLKLIGTLDLARALDLNRIYKRNIDHILNNTLDMFIDIFTLQERIAGRSPAFEGIRLVKERK